MAGSADWAGSCNYDEDEGPYLPIHNSGSRKTQKSCSWPTIINITTMDRGM